MPTEPLLVRTPPVEKQCTRLMHFAFCCLIVAQHQNSVENPWSRQGYIVPVKSSVLFVYIYMCGLLYHYKMYRIGNSVNMCDQLHLATCTCTWGSVARVPGISYLTCLDIQPHTAQSKKQFVTRTCTMWNLIKIIIVILCTKQIVKVHWYGQY